jgi:hypothetical protein
MYKNRITKLIKIGYKVGEEVQERVGSEFDQSTLYTKMEISQ